LPNYYLLANRADKAGVGRKFPKMWNLRPKKLGKIRRKKSLEQGPLNMNARGAGKLVWQYNCKYYPFEVGSTHFEGRGKTHYDSY
jgi:hypothetical protein